LTRLLDWMATRDFSELVASGLLRDVEEILVDSHRQWYEQAGRPWSPPAAYQWLRYETSDPVIRLKEGAKKLGKRGAKFGADAVDKACAKAAGTGFLN
jgi:hypothetical protein